MANHTHTHTHTRKPTSTTNENIRTNKNELFKVSINVLVQCLPGMWETQVRPRRISWRKEPGRLQSMGSQRVRHD